MGEDPGIFTGDSWKCSSSGNQLTPALIARLGGWTGPHSKHRYLASDELFSPGLVRFLAIAHTVLLIFEHPTRGDPLTWRQIVRSFFQQFLALTPYILSVKVGIAFHLLYDLYQTVLRFSPYTTEHLVQHYISDNAPRLMI